MRKRTHLRGVLWGLLAHFIIALIVAFIVAEVAKLISTANGVVSPLKEGPFKPFSAGWLLSRPLELGIGFVAGLVSAYSSPPKSWVAPTILAFGSVALALTNLPQPPNFIVLSAWFLLTPVGLLSGALFYMRRLEPREA
jgi:hypothetical protein